MLSGTITTALKDGPGGRKNHGVPSKQLLEEWQPPKAHQRRLLCTESDSAATKERQLSRSTTMPL